MELLEAFYLRHTSFQFGIIEKNLLMVTQPHKCNQCQQCVQLTGMSFMLLHVFVDQKKKNAFVKNLPIRHFHLGKFLI